MRKINLKALSVEELGSFLSGLGLPKYRTSQLVHWIYDKRARTIEEITEFSKPLRAMLGEKAYISELKVLDRLASSDGTEKFLFELEDGQSIESVLIPDGKRLTLCVSTQVGCAMNCRFCLTGKTGFKRNLKAYEIVDQIITVGRLILPARITNIVLMGMGEPLKNFAEVTAALSMMTGLLHISNRKITVSTSGLVKEMLELPQKAPVVNLAVSLNATTDDVRDFIMPINKKYPIKMLMDACRKFPLPKRRRITFEYVLVDGLNDTRADAKRLASLIKTIPSKVNLIPLNEFEGCEFKKPPEKKILDFQKVLLDAGVTALIRKSKGQDILAACGQLKAKNR
jgi:23S rRNA (adenine2503-C2)-methyltransferase